MPATVALVRCSDFYLAQNPELPTLGAWEPPRCSDMMLGNIAGVLGAYASGAAYAAARRSDFTAEEHVMVALGQDLELRRETEPDVLETVGDAIRAVFAPNRSERAFALGRVTARFFRQTYEGVAAAFLEDLED